MSRPFEPGNFSVRILGALTVVTSLIACSDNATQIAPTAPPYASALAVNNGANNRRILFASNRFDSLGVAIFSMNPDGSGLTQLTDAKEISLQPAWSPDGKRVAFVSSRHEANGSEVYVMNADGSAVTRLTNSIGFDVEPTWSKDGKRIAFASSRAADDPTRGALYDLDIYIMNADGSGVTRLTSAPLGDYAPSWSPDGKQLAFASQRDFVGTPITAQAELYTMNTDGSQVTRITYENSFAGNPSWAPGGKEIAFDVVPPGETALAVFVVNADGTHLTRLTSGDDDGDAQPSWSPDGKQLVFASGRDGGIELYRMNADGTGQTRLTVTPTGINLFPAWNR